MPDIASIGSGSVGPVHRTSSASAAYQVSDRTRDDERVDSQRPSAQLGDRVELSDRARYLSHLRELPEVRSERVEQVQTAIADGSYLSDEKIDVAINRLLDDLNL
ncbi:MAG: flagellar biosynthesis anti-sigma factor FlgM [Planctomycetota bacterium]